LFVTSDREWSSDGLGGRSVDAVMSQNHAFVVDVSQEVGDRHKTELPADLQVNLGCFARPSFFALYNGVYRATGDRQSINQSINQPDLQFLSSKASSTLKR